MRHFRARGSFTLIAIAGVIAVSAAASAQPAAPPTFLQSLDVKSPSLAFGVGDRVIVRSTNGGRSWRVYSVTGLRGIAGASFRSASQWWVAGSSVGPVPTGSESFGPVPILYTSDAGSTWHRSLLSRRYPDGHGYVAFAFANRRDGWLTVQTVGNLPRVDLYRTSDGGASWQFLANRFGFLGPIRFAGGRLWATTGGSSGGLVRSNDLGRSWQAVSLPTPGSLNGETRTVALPKSMGSSSSDLALETMYSRSAGATVLVYVSGDGGRHWRATKPITARVFGNFGVGVVPPAAFTDRERWLVADNSTLFWTDDAGRTWRRGKAVLAGSRIPLWLSSIAFPTMRLGFGLIQYGHCAQFKRNCTQRSFVVRTTDRGRHWTVLALKGAAGRMSRCPLAQLKLARLRLRISEATQENTVLFQLTNDGRRACLLRGHPTIALFDRRGAILPFLIKPEAAPHLRGVVLRSGESGYFLLRKLTCVVADRARARRLLLSLPGDRHITASVAMPPQRDISFCGRGDRGSVVGVSAFFSAIPLALRSLP